eukprot:1151454-Pelagomonas_calceolata.AAC.9
MHVYRCCCSCCGGRAVLLLDRVRLFPALQASCPSSKLRLVDVAVAPLAVASIAPAAVISAAAACVGGGAGTAAVTPALLFDGIGKEKVTWLYLPAGQLS